VRMSLSRLASQCEVALCAEAGKYHLLGLARVCMTSEDKKRATFEVQEVVLVWGNLSIERRGRASNPRLRYQSHCPDDSSVPSEYIERSSKTDL